MNPKTERDREVCRLHRDERVGVKELSKRFFVTEMRIRQILRKGAAFVPVGKTGRQAFLGINLTPEAKKALRAKAEGEGVSMSQMVSDKVEEMIK